MEPNSSRWARIGPTDRSWFIQVPPGGLCLSSFVMVEDRAGRVLLGRPALHPAWSERGSLPVWRLQQIIENQEWVLPATHLLFGEHPEHGARRIAREWAGLPKARPEFVAIDSGQRRSTARRAGRPQNHWDLGFVYRVRAGRLPKRGPWWAETRFMSRPQWLEAKVGRGHRDTLLAYALATGGRTD